MKNIAGSQILALAVNVRREAARDRMLLILTTFGILMFLISMVLGQMAIGGSQRIVQSTGFWILGVWGLVIVLYLGSNIVRQEIQRKTVYLVLARPVHRITFLLGKFTGMLIVLSAAFVLLSLAWIVVLKISAVQITALHIWAMGFIFGEWILLSAFSLFFATFTSPLLHNFFLVGVAFLGHWSQVMRALVENVPSAGAKLLFNLIYHLLPNLEALNFRTAALYQEPVEAVIFINAFVVLLLWIISALIGANLIFMRRRLL